MQPEKIISDNENNHIIEDDNYWKSHIDACEKAKLSRKAYCRQTGLVYHRFKYWQNKLQSKPKPLKAIPVQVQAVNSSDLLCTLKLTGGHELLVHDQSALSLVLSRLI